MKYHLFVISFLLSGVCMRAQITNTFPESGYVGIGLNNPSTPLMILDPRPIISLFTQGGVLGQTSGIDFYGTFGAAGNGDMGTRRFAQIKVGSVAPQAWDGAYFSIYGITPDGGTPVELVHINTWSGNVGLGASTPQALLHLRRDDGMERTTLLIENSGIGSDYKAGSSGVTFGKFDGTQTRHQHIYYSITGPGWSDSRITITSYLDGGSTDNTLNVTGGKVGIGTAKPDAKLTIEGDASAPVLLNVGGNSNGRLRVRHIDGKQHDSGLTDHLFLQYGVNYNTYIGIGGTGNVSIGTWSADYKLNVAGTIRAKEVIVDTGWSDYVFDKSHRLQPLDEVEQHIKEKGCLPGIPSAANVAEKGVSLGDMQALLLAKIEELTLHQIDLQKNQRQLESRVKELEQENAALKKLADAPNK